MSKRSILVTLAALALAGCAHGPETTRGAMSGQIELARPDQTVALTREKVLHEQYDVQGINISVPTSLTTSEANSFHPNVDIVWRGDAPGDRYAQVKAIFETAMARGTETMHKGPAVVVDIEVTKFHAVTQKTRFTVGGIHNMRFWLTVRDAATGAVIQGPRMINADCHAAGGALAIQEDAAGLTQKVVVTNRLAEVIRRELSAPVQNIAPNTVVSRFDGTPVQLTMIE